MNNDNVSKTLTNNVIDNVSNRTSSEVDSIAENLSYKLKGGLSSKAFYCKVGYKLSESQINRNLELAMTGRNPQRYFTWLCKRDMNCG